MDAIDTDGGHEVRRDAVVRASPLRSVDKTPEALHHARREAMRIAREAKPMMEAGPSFTLADLEAIRRTARRSEEPHVVG